MYCLKYLLIDEDLLLIYPQTSKNLCNGSKATQLQCTKILALKYLSSCQVHINNEKSAKDEVDVVQDVTSSCFLVFFPYYTTLKFCRMLPAHFSGALCF